jgi:hypothetical protein
MKLVIGSVDVFVIFDSHSRPDHPDGAVFILNTSIHRTAIHLTRILPVDHRLLSDNGLQWQAQLLANFSGHTFVSSRPDIFPEHTIQTITESSLSILTLRAEISDLKLQNSVLTSENKRLVAEKQLEDERRDERMKILFSSPKHRNSNRYAPRSANAAAGPSRPGDRHSMQSNAHKHPEPDEKNRHRWKPPQTTRRSFHCPICMEDHVEDNVARIDSCGHSFCRECIRDHVGFKLDQNRFPILCPVCMTEHTKDEPGSE